jgi:hypothetical protein
VRTFLIAAKSINLKSIIRVNQNIIEINIINIKDKIIFNLTKKEGILNKTKAKTNPNKISIKNCLSTSKEILSIFINKK